MERHSPEWVSKLCELWSEGHSASAIAIELECTKNAVIGKVHRLGLPGRPSPIKGPKIAPEKKENIAQLLAVGASYEEIKSKLHVGADTIAGVKKGLRRLIPRPIVSKPKAEPQPPQKIVYLNPRPGQCTWLDGHRPHWTQCTAKADSSHPSWCKEHYKRVFIIRRKDDAA